jgi:hypothetical protein
VNIVLFSHYFIAVLIPVLQKEIFYLNIYLIGQYKVFEFDFELGPGCKGIIAKVAGLK